MIEGVLTTMATAEELQLELEKLRAENETLKKRAERPPSPCTPAATRGAGRRIRRTRYGGWRSRRRRKRGRGRRSE